MSNKKQPLFTKKTQTQRWTFPNIVDLQEVISRLAMF